MAWELTTWKPLGELTPFRDFERMTKEMDRFGNSFLEETLRKIREDGTGWFPSLDVSETKKDFVVKAELPGMDLKDIDLSLTNGMLTIRGEKKQEKEEKEGNYHLIGRSYGTFSRSVSLPRDVKQDKISASYKDGVLRVVLPKSEEAKKKEIKIKVE